MTYDSTKETLEHISEVQKKLLTIISKLQIRAFNHDKTKLLEPEKSIFDIYTPKLKETTYGSKEYEDNLKNMKNGLDHHYSKNRHHPEHFSKSANGLKYMNLIDITEMLCDWLAATKRHNDGNIYKSIEQNQKRFGYSDELKNILFNTIEMMD